MNIKTTWLTLNRSCNLRCEWCYAKNTEFDTSQNMSLEDAKRVVDFCKEADVDHITLIGGEPTMYKDLLEIAKYINSNGLKSVLVTNGVLLANKEYLEKLIDVGIDIFSVSLKGETQEIFKDITGVDKFNKVLDGIKLLKEKGCRFSTSMVLTPENMSNVHLGIKSLYEYGAEKISLSFCYEFNVKQYENSTYKENNNPAILIKTFMDNYDSINEASNGRFVLAQSLPLCMWDLDFIDMLMSRGQLGAVCSLIRGTGLVIDTDLAIIPCNLMNKIQLGKFGEDFKSFTEYKEFLSRPDTAKAYRRLQGVPSMDCVGCKMLRMCGGGCAVQYTNYTFDELMKTKEDYQDELKWDQDYPERVVLSKL